jgi:hypothetical protein
MSFQLYLVLLECFCWTCCEPLWFLSSISITFIIKWLNPKAIAFSSLIKIKAAAPSLIVEAFAAVTVPSFVKTA